eukprot:c24406_g3_i1 orf=163-453(+)
MCICMDIDCVCMLACPYTLAHAHRQISHLPLKPFFKEYNRIDVNRSYEHKTTLMKTGKAQEVFDSFPCQKGAPFPYCFPCSVQDHELPQRRYQRPS